jgi:hypothetical protein
VLVGEDGTCELDQDGRHHGLLARLRRTLQCITEERGHIEEYAWAYSRVKVVVVIHLQSGDHKPAVSAAFKNSGAHFIQHYGAWMAHTLSA